MTWQFQIKLVFNIHPRSIDNIPYRDWWRHILKFPLNTLNVVWCYWEHYYDEPQNVNVMGFNYVSMKKNEEFPLYSADPTPTSFFSRILIPQFTQRRSLHRVLFGWRGIRFQYGGCILAIWINANTENGVKIRGFSSTHNIKSLTMTLPKLKVKWYGSQFMFLWMYLNYLTLCVRCNIGRIPKWRCYQVILKIRSSFFHP